MFVIADQETIRVRRKGGFAGAREAKEQADIAISADIGSTVHGHDIFFRQQEVLH